MIIQEKRDITQFLLTCFVLLPIRGGLGYEYDYTNGEYVRDHDPDAWNSMDVRSIIQHQCVPIPESLTLCRNVGYTNMSLPNLLGHDTLAEVKKQAAPWVLLYKVMCHPNTDLFLCSLYAPVCLDRPIFPCQSLCEAVQQKCAARMSKYGFKWPEILRCDKFPQDDNLCIKQINFPNTTGQGRTGSEAENVCLACKQPTTFESLLDSYCWANFEYYSSRRWCCNRSSVWILLTHMLPEAIIILPTKCGQCGPRSDVVKARLHKTVIDHQGDKRIVFKGKRVFYKPKSNILSKQEADAMEPVITDGSNCECEALDKPGKRLLIMGAVQGDRFVVTYVSAWSKNREFKRAIHAIRKGHDCKKQIEEIAGLTDANNGGLSTDTPIPSVDKEIDTGVTSPTDTGTKVDVNETEKKKKGNKKKKGKGKGKGKGRGKGKGKGKGKGRGKGKGKGKKKNKDKKGTTDPMENIAGIGCIPCKQPLAFGNLVEKYCAANFVVKARVKRLRMDDNGDKRLMIRMKKKSSLYRQVNMSKRDIRKLQPVISGGANCDCLSANPGKGNLFIMGKKVGNRFVISFLSEYVKDSEFKRFTRAVRKGYDCSSNSQTPGTVNRA